MVHKTLALVVAAGQGRSVKKFLEPDESIKPMLKVGGKRLIEKVIDQLKGMDVSRATLTYPSSEYRDLNTLLENRGVTVLEQVAPHLKLPYLAELPLILLWQYHMAGSGKSLRIFDSIIILQSDILLERVHLNEMLGFHRAHLESPEQAQVTLLSKLGEHPGGKTELFKMDGDRIKWRKAYKGEVPEGYIAATQAGVYIITRGALRNPLELIPYLGNGQVLLYPTQGTWTDYGNPQAIIKMRQNL